MTARTTQPRPSKGPLGERGRRPRERPGVVPLAAITRRGAVPIWPRASWSCPLAAAKAASQPANCRRHVGWSRSPSPRTRQGTRSLIGARFQPDWGKPNVRLIGGREETGASRLCRAARGASRLPDHAGSTRAEFGRRGRGEMPFAAAYRPAQLWRSRDGVRSGASRTLRSGLWDLSGPAPLPELPSGRAHSLSGMPSRNDPCPCGSAKKFKRCCLERLKLVARELRARDELVDDVVAWLRAEHEQTIDEALSEAMWIRALGGVTGRSMSFVWALNDYRPGDGGPSLMARYAERPELTPPARAIARGLTDARLDVYQVGATVPGLWLELAPLRDNAPVRLGWQDGFFT